MDFGSSGEMSSRSIQVPTSATRSFLRRRMGLTFEADFDPDVDSASIVRRVMPPRRAAR